MSKYFTYQDILYKYNRVKYVVKYVYENDSVKLNHYGGIVQTLLLLHNL